MKKDACIIKIEEIWDDAKPDPLEDKEAKFKVLAQSLSLLVKYLKTSEGIPDKFQRSVQTKIDFLEGLLPIMGLNDASTAISSIKYARRQLKSHVVAGSRFRRGITPQERKRASEIGKPVILSGPGINSRDIQLAVDEHDDDIDDFRSDLLDSSKSSLD